MRQALVAAQQAVPLLATPPKRPAAAPREESCSKTAQAAHSWRATGDAEGITSKY